MRRSRFFLSLVACVFVLTGFTWPNEKTAKSSQVETAPKQSGAVQEAPVSRGSDLMEGVVTALELEAEPAVVTMQFTSGQKTSVEIAKDTTVFRKDQVLGLAELKKGDRLRVEYVTAGTVKTAKNIEIVEVAAPVAAKKAPVKAAAEKALEPADKKSAEIEPADKKLDE